jgi:hypothetical protein
MELASKELACHFFWSKKFRNNIILKKFEKMISEKFSIEKILIQLLTVNFIEERFISSHNIQNEYMKQIKEILKCKPIEQNRNNTHNIDSALLFSSSINQVTNLKSKYLLNQP